MSASRNNSVALNDKKDGQCFWKSMLLFVTMELEIYFPLLWILRHDTFNIDDCSSMQDDVLYIIMYQTYILAY